MAIDVTCQLVEVVVNFLQGVVLCPAKPRALVVIEPSLPPAIKLLPLIPKKY